MEIFIWLVLVPLAGVGVVTWIYRMPDHGAVPRRISFVWSRLLGQHHQFRRGRLLEPGEEVCYRARLMCVKVYSVDGYISETPRALCIVTHCRVMIQNEQGFKVQLVAGDIRAVRTHRDHDQRHGFSYWVVMERVGSLVHEVEGDVALRCASQEQSQVLFSAIQSITAVGTAP